MLLLRHTQEGAGNEDLKGSIDMSGELIHVVGRPHPLRTERIESFVVAGQTLEQIVSQGLRDLNVPSCMWGHGHAYVGETYVPREQWGSVVPQPGMMVTYRIVPQGGGKNPFRALLSIIVIAVAAFTGQAWAVGMGFSATGLVATGLTMGITALGMLAINSLIPLKLGSALDAKDKEKDSNVYSLAGSTNQTSKFGAIPVLLGKHRVVPPQAGLPYTELSGDDQYVMQLFCMGYTGMSLQSDIRVGETDSSDYEEFNIEILNGAVEGAIPTYYQNDVYETNLAIELKNEDGPSTRVTDQAGHTFSIDLVANQGLVEYSTTDGSKLPKTVELRGRWRVKDTEEWFDIGGTSHYVKGGEVKTPSVKVAVSPRFKPWSIYVRSDGSLASTSGDVPASGFGIVKVELTGVNPFDPLSGLVDLRKAGKYTGLTYARTRPGSSTVTIGEGTCVLPLISFTAKSTKPIRKTVTPGKVSDTPAYFEVEVSRVTPDSTSSSVADVFHWATIRSINYRSPIGKVKPIDLMSIRVKATGELTGTIDQLNFDAISVCPDWDSTTSTWITRPTNNPASLYRYVLQHPANAKPKPDSAINLAVLQDWHVFCEEKGLAYNRYYDFRSSISDVLKEVAAAGLASIDRTDGLWGVVIERPRDTWKQLFTPRNSWNFKSTRAYPEMPHGWRVTFNNEEAEYQADEIIVYADGYDESNADLFEGIEFPGVTDPKQIIRLGRQYYADALLCREEYSFEVDFEHLVCTRGDRIKCAHPVTMWGLAQGRVKSSDPDEQVVVVDEICSMVYDKFYSLRWRTDTGEQVLRSVETNPGSQTVLYLSGEGEVPSKGDVFAFGETNEETVDLVVKQVVGRGEYLNARLICKDYIAEVFDAVDRELPPYNTHITIPYAIVPVPTPEVTQTISTAIVVGGVVTMAIQIGFTASDGEEVQIQYKLVASAVWVDSGRADIAVGLATVKDVDDDEYEIRIRTIKGLRTSNWVTFSYRYSLESAMAVIAASWSAALSDFTAVTQNEHINLHWTPQPNITSYEIRFGDDWDSGTVVATGITTNTWAWQPTESGTLQFFLRGTVVPGWVTIETASTWMSVTAPAVTNLISKVIGNNVLLSWTNVDGSYAIETVEVSEGLEYSSSEIVGKVNGTFSSIFESKEGTYKYWVTPIDKVGLRGEPVGVYVAVSQPSGYVFLSKTYLTWAGTKTNILIENGRIYGLVNTTETFQQHFTANGFISPQAQIDAGLPYFLQPGSSTATYSETIDHGAIIPASSITLSVTRTSIVGTVTVTPTISYSLDGVSWETGTEGSYKIFANNFRYTKIDLEISSADRGIVEIADGYVTLDAQEKSFSGSVDALASDVGGTVVPVTGFLDIQDISVNAVGTAPVLTACDYDDTGNPTSFTVFAFNPVGLTRVDALLKYTVKGV